MRNVNSASQTLMSFIYLLVAAAITACAELPSSRNDANFDGSASLSALALSGGNGSANGEPYSGQIRPKNGTYYNGVTENVVMCAGGKAAVLFRSKIEVLDDKIVHYPDSCTDKTEELALEDIEYSIHIPGFISYQDRQYEWRFSLSDVGIRMAMYRWCYSEGTMVDRTEVVIAHVYRSDRASLFMRAGAVYSPQERLRTVYDGSFPRVPPGIPNVGIRSRWHDFQIESINTHQFTLKLLLPGKTCDDHGCRTPAELTRHYRRYDYRNASQETLELTCRMYRWY